VPDVTEIEQREAVERPLPRLHWYREVAVILAFYGVYSLIRNQFGSNATSPAHAFHNAQHVIHVQKAMGLFVELHIQEAFAGWGRGFFWFWNVYYGTLHFVVTAGVLVWVYRRHPDRYPRWRNTLGTVTGLALIGFSAFPLMPPRLLDAGGPFGWYSSYHFVDTLARYGGPWSFDSGTVQSVSNQYAAMPSLHVGWSLWCCCAVYPMLRHRWSRALFVIYPLATTFAIVVTGNHYWLDAAGGALVFFVAYLLAGKFELAKARVRANRRPDSGGVLVG
jgi:hypothetical protein